jgi:hypothetical protein
VRLSGARTWPVAETYALKMTAKGLKAATVTIEGADGKDVPSATPGEKKTGRPPPREAPLVGEHTPGSDALGLDGARPVEVRYADPFQAMLFPGFPV